MEFAHFPKNILRPSRVSRPGQGGQAGQVMILTILTLGATLLGATTIAGLLMIYQLRQSTDMANSAKAFSAADAGLEWGLYQAMRGTALPPLTFSNEASVDVKCYDAGQALVSCNASSVTSIRSLGKSARSSRALQASF